jgi:hypothetical protein
LAAVRMQQVQMYFASFTREFYLFYWHFVLYHFAEVLFMSGMRLNFRQNLTPESKENNVEYKFLSNFHYRGHRIAGPHSIFRLTRSDELCGVIVYCYSPPSCFGRRLMLPQMSMRELNQKLSIINRVVVYPKYRTIGLGSDCSNI